VLDHVSWLRGAAKLPEDEAGHGVVVLDRQVDAELLVEVVDRERAVDPDAPVRELLDRLVREVELVLDLADDLLEQVLERDNTLHRAILVDDDRHVLLLAAKLVQEGGEVLGLGNDVRRADQALEADVADTAGAMGLPEQIADM